MDTRLIKSFVVLGLVGALGVGATYAQLTSNTVTISGNTINTPDAKIKVCNNAVSSGAGWDTSLAGFKVNNLAPGASTELTAGKVVSVGNDDGTLATEGQNDGDANSCASYTAPAENSGVALNIVPQVVQAGCNGDLANDLTLTFQLDSGTEVADTLFNWTTNTTSLGPTLAPGDFYNLTVDVALSNDATDAETSCTFDINLTGQQAPPPPV